MSFIGVIMLMGLVAKNAILLLDAARVLEEGMAREDADGRRPQAAAPDPDDHLRADRRHDAGGHRRGRGGEFYRPMAVAIMRFVFRLVWRTLRRLAGRGTPRETAA